MNDRATYENTMTGKAYYITHPQVSIDPDIDVPRWGLSDVGKQRVASLVDKLSSNEAKKHELAIVSSDEVKAVETAKPIADFFKCELIIDPLMGENDRSATGFLKPDKFEQVANQFFSNPDENILGWESARDAQKRIVDRFNAHLSDNEDLNIIFVGHGAVGTLLYCHLAGETIDRKFDQTGGGGNFYKIDTSTSSALTHWQPIENFSF